MANETKMNSMMITMKMILDSLFLYESSCEFFQLTLKSSSLLCFIISIIWVLPVTKVSLLSKLWYSKMIQIQIIVLEMFSFIFQLIFSLLFSWLLLFLLISMTLEGYPCLLCAYCSLMVEIDFQRILLFSCCLDLFKEVLK